MKNMKKLILLILIPLFAISLILSIAKHNLWNFESKSYLTSKRGSTDSLSFNNNSNNVTTNNSSSFDFSDFNGKFTLMEFSATKGDKIDLLDSSNVSKGLLYIVVVDSDYKDIAIHKSTGKSTIELNIPKDGKYLIRIAGKKAGGRLDLALNSNKNLDLVHKSMWADE